MVNLHQICRLCMVDIGIQGVDCSAIADMRNAIEILYKLEIKPDDECSKRVCQKCVALVADFILHQRTVKDTQEKIKQCIDLQKQINNTHTVLKEEIQDTAVPIADQVNGNAAPASESNVTNPSQRKNTERAENAQRTSRSAENAQRTSGSAENTDVQNRTKNTDRGKTHTRSGNASTSQPQSRAKNAVSAESLNLPRSTRSSSRERINADKKRRRSTVHERIEQTEGQRAKRSKTISSPRSDGGNADVNNATNESFSGVTNHTVRHQQLSKSPSTPKRSRRQDSLPSTSGQGSILKYLSKPSCSKCNAVFKTMPESRFHDKCHAKKRCVECQKSVRTTDVKDHVYTCLLMAGKLSTKEMMLYMKPLQIILNKLPTVKRENDVQNDSVPVPDSSDKDSEVIRPARRINSNKLIIIDSSSEEDARDTATASVPTKQPVNVSCDANSAVETAVEMPSQKKKVARRESTVQRQEKCATQFGKNTSLSVTWNRLATNNRLFYTQTPYTKLTSHYITVESMTINHNLNELEKIRLKMAARTRNVPANADKETSARKLSAVHRFSNTRMSVSDIDRNRVPICDGERLVKHVNAVVLFPATFDTNERPLNQPSRRKSVHSISIGTAVFNRTDEHGLSSPIQIPVVARPAAGLSAYAPIANKQQIPKQIIESNGQNNSTESQSPVSVPSQRPNDYRANGSHISSTSIPTTSAAALAATSSPSSSATASTAAPPLCQVQFLSPRPQPATIPNFKVLSVTELNSRAVQLNNNENEPIQKNISHVNNVKMKYVPTAPKTPTQPDQSNANNAGEENVNPIHVTLIKRQGNELELTLTRSGQKMPYESLSESQREEVQKSLLSNGVWKQMLHHIKLGSPSPHTLELFRRLLPPVEQQYFFTQYYAAKGLNNSFQ